MLNIFLIIPPFRLNALHNTDRLDDKLDDGRRVLHALDDGDVARFESVETVDGALEGRDGLRQVVLTVVTDCLGRHVHHGPDSNLPGPPQLPRWPGPRHRLRSLSWLQPGG